MILLGFGAGIAFNPVLLAAMSDVEAGGVGPRLGHRQHGVHDGRRARPGRARKSRRLAHRHADREGHSHLSALTGGYHAAFVVGALFAIAAAVVGTVLLRTSKAPADTPHEPAVAAREPAGVA